MCNVQDNVKCSYCSYSVVFKLSTTMLNVLTIPTVWYFNCSRQCGMFLLFRQFGILTVTDNAEYFYCSNIVVF